MGTVIALTVFFYFMHRIFQMVKQHKEMWAAYNARPFVAPNVVRFPSRRV
jgi:hypothetical protein